MADPQTEIRRAIGRMHDRATMETRRDRERLQAAAFEHCQPGFTSLPDWFARDHNAYWCSLIARQIRTRAMMRGQTDAARAEAQAIADMIETGDFDWLV